MASRILSIVAVALVGCTSGSGDPPLPLPGSGSTGTDVEYPDGPYGTTQGQVIEPYAFPGYVAPADERGEAARTELSLAHFYNPTGEDVFGPEDPFPEGAPKPRALVVNVSAVWCAPCKLEAEQLLPDEYERIRPLRGELLLVLADSETPGEAAGFDNLDAWVANFPVSYPSVIDPSYQLGALFDINSFPGNFLIDTRDMTIVQLVKGIPDETFWAQVDALLE